MRSPEIHQYVWRVLPDVATDTASVSLLLLESPVNNSPGVTLVCLGRGGGGGATQTGRTNVTHNMMRQLPPTTHT